MDRKEYTRVPGRGADGFFPFIRWKSKLYWGNNHLLLRNTNLSIDRYNRFFYDKIQSVTIQDSTKRRKNNFIWGCSTGFFASMFMIGLFSGGHFRLHSIYFFFAAILILSIFCLSANNILGPTCRFFIRTSIKQTEIHCLCRKKHADVFFTLLVGKLNSIQGELQKEKAHALLDQETESPVPTINSNSE